MRKKMVLILTIISMNTLSMPKLNIDHLTQNKLPLDDNSELASSLFLYQLAFKNKQSGDDLFGPNICLQVKPSGNNNESNTGSGQIYKLVTKNANFESGKSKIKSNQKDIQRLKKITDIMNTYFNATRSTPIVTATGYTDGEHIAGKKNTNQANSKLGIQRAKSLAKALKLEDVISNSYTSKRGESDNVSKQKRKCENRRVTTLEFKVHPRLKLGRKGHYTPSFTMIQDHQDIKQYATLSALKMLNDHKGNVDEAIKTMPEVCRTESTRSILKRARYAALGKKSSLLNLGPTLKKVFPNKIKDKNSLVYKMIKNIRATKGRVTTDKKGRLIDEHRLVPVKFNPDELLQIINKISKHEQKRKNKKGRRYIKKTILSDINTSPIKQSNHAFDCFDVKDYYKENTTNTNDVSNFIKDNKLKISFTKHDFAGEGQHLKCGKCGSGMKLTKENKISHNLRTDKTFTDMAKNQSYNSSEDLDANQTIKMSSGSNFNTMSSHKSLKVVVIKNCVDKNNIDIFAPENTILSINKLPFEKTIANIPTGSKICIVNMPVVNTCTIEPQGVITPSKSPQKTYAQFYKLDGTEVIADLLKDNLSSLSNDNLDEIVQAKFHSCSSEAPKKKKLTANELIDTLSCKEKGILVPNESNNATEEECPQYYPTTPK